MDEKLFTLKNYSFKIAIVHVFEQKHLFVTHV